MGERWFASSRGLFSSTKIAGDVKDATENLLSNGNGDWLPGVGKCHATLETVGGGHRDRPDPSVAKVLLDLEDQLRIDIVENIVDLKSVVDFRKSGWLLRNQRR